MTTDLVVLVPSRGRPRAAKDLKKTFADTCKAYTRLLFILDESDPTLDGYRNCVPVQDFIVGEHTSMVEALNHGAEWAIEQMEPFALGFMGDDHRPRTLGWDSQVLNVLQAQQTGIVYGNDLLQGENLPTQVFMTSNIPRTLGYMAMPFFHHLYVDNWWKELGEGASCLHYLDEVVIEHMHPAAGKAEMDDNYRRVNARQVDNADRGALIKHRQVKLSYEIQAIKELMA